MSPAFMLYQTKSSKVAARTRVQALFLVRKHILYYLTGRTAALHLHDSFPTFGPRFSHRGMLTPFITSREGSGGARGRIKASVCGVRILGI